MKKNIPTVEAALEMTLVDFREVLPTREQLDALKAIDLVRCMDRLKRLQDELKTLTQPVNELLDSVRFSVLPRAMETEGMESMNVTGVGKVSLTSDVRVTIPAAQKEAAYEWLVKEGSGDLISETVNAASLAAFVRLRMKKGNPVPSDMFKVSAFTRATITKA